MGVEVFAGQGATVAEAVGRIAAEAAAAGAWRVPRLVVYFASPKYDPAAVSAAMARAFPAAITVGCTTAGEIVSGEMRTGSIVAMGIDSSIIEDVAVSLLEDAHDLDGVAREFARFEEHFRMPMRSLDPARHVGLVLVDGLSGAEERLMERIGDLADVLFVGGSAGDDLAFRATHVFAEGMARSGAAVLVLLRLRKGFGIVKTQSFRSTGARLRATRVDEARRAVLAFDGKPAVEAYAEALGIPVESAQERFMTNPLGLVAGDEPFIRSPQRVEGTEMRFYCNIKEGMEMHVMTSTDIVEDTRKAIEDEIRRHGPVAGIIDFHCILRTLELRQKAMCEAYGALFAEIPAIGFSTYGEEFLGHINQTSTMLVLRE